jgi:hypothetical protein
MRSRTCRTTRTSVSGLNWQVGLKVGLRKLISWRVWNRLNANWTTTLEARLLPLLLIKPRNATSLRLRLLLTLLLRLPTLLLPQGTWNLGLELKGDNDPCPRLGLQRLQLENVVFHERAVELVTLAQGTGTTGGTTWQLNSLKGCKRCYAGSLAI